MKNSIQKTTDKLNSKIQDYISGAWVNATKEEIVVQELLQRLHLDYGYPKDAIQAHPQFLVPKSPSDSEKGSWPVDVAIFSNIGKARTDVSIIIEVKQPNVKEGVKQLKRYLERCDASVGVWTNGGNSKYLRKVYTKGGSIEYVDIPDIPRYGQKVEEIGRFKRNQLVVPSDLKSVFTTIRGYLAGNAEGLTRDESLATEIINLLFCKLYDELNTAPEDQVRFFASIEDNEKEVANRISGLFDKVKKEFPDVFDQSDKIILAPKDVYRVVGTLQNYCIKDADRDAIGDAFEVFIGPAIKGDEGQFFTPRNAVSLVCDLAELKSDDRVVDPACGSGGFLIVALERAWKQLDQHGNKMGWDSATLAVKQKEMAARNFSGIDKDRFLVRTSKAYMAIMGDGRGGIFCENSLLPVTDWNQKTQDRIKKSGFDVVLANPPYGKNIKVEGDFLKDYDLGKEWEAEEGGHLMPTNKVLDYQIPQILFLERMYDLLEPGGRLSVVLPAGLFASARKYKYVWKWLQDRMDITAVVDLPKNLFKTSGKGGTSTQTAILVARKLVPGEPRLTTPIFMAVPEACGHDSRANIMYKKDLSGALIKDENGQRQVFDELPEVAAKYKELQLDSNAEQNHLGFLVQREEIKDNTFVPSYYLRKMTSEVSNQNASWVSLTLQELQVKNIIEVKQGYGVAKDWYSAKGTIPYVRTGDIVNGQIATPTGRSIHREAWMSLDKTNFCKEGDILMAKDGDDLIGNAAILGKLDTEMAVQGHVIRIRVLENTEGITSELLFMALQSSTFRLRLRAEIFTQDTLGTVGKRLYEVGLPFPPAGQDRKTAHLVAKNIVSKLLDVRQAVLSIQNEWGIEEKIEKVNGLEVLTDVDGQVNPIEMQ